MKLVRLVFQQYRWPLAWVLLLSVSSGLLSVGVIAFVNQRMISSHDGLGTALWQFGLMLAVLLALASGASLSLTALGHRFV
jgi:putative ATP-binding cassette transporter